MKVTLQHKVPDFTLLDKEGNSFDATQVIGKKTCVLYFYPKNFTPGCTKEACSFRDAYQDFQKYGAEVIGISSDSVNSHKKFSKKYNLPFIFLSDPEGEVRKKYGVKSHLLGLIPGRETFVIDKDKKLQFRFNDLSAKKHMQKALEIVKQLQHE